MKNCGALARRGLLKLGILLMTLAALPAAAAQKPLGVVELFTSQGCSSCPPADALLAELAQRDDVVALAYHVDYWDYLGWKDELATPENTARQRAYAQVLDSSVYTPQMVVNGREHFVGSRREAIIGALEENALGVDVEVSSRNGSVFVDVGAAAAENASAHLVLVYYKPQQTVAIGRGENKGRAIEYHNIVTGFQTIGMWHGKPMRVELPKSEMRKKGGRCAVLLQSVDAEGRPGPVLGAARAMADDW